MQAFADVDEVIDAWARTNVKSLFTEWAGAPARFAYVPGLRPFECFQIAIDPPSAGVVAVSATSVDTDDGSEFEQRWEGPIETLALMLEEASKAVDGWVRRSPTNGN